MSTFTQPSTSGSPPGARSSPPPSRGTPVRRTFLNPARWVGACCGRQAGTTASALRSSGKDPVSISADHASGGAPHSTRPENGVTLNDDTDTLREQGRVVKTINGARAVVVLLTVVAALGLASCGGSSAPTNSTRRTKPASPGIFGSRMVVCLRKHVLTSSFHRGGRYDTVISRIRAAVRDCGARSVRSISGFVPSGAAVKMLERTPPASRSTDTSCQGRTSPARDRCSRSALTTSASTRRRRRTACRSSGHIGHGLRRRSGACWAPPARSRHKTVPPTCG